MSTNDAMQTNNIEEDATVTLPSVKNIEGSVIAGRYKITQRIGKGGMGVVYLAQQTNLCREVVIKILSPQLVDDEEAIVRFEREARGLSKLKHPNIVTIYDFGRDNQLAYIAMEYAQGETLGKFLKHAAPLDMDTFLPIAVQILKGIGEAHKLGLIHRDIKPANIILCELDGEKNFVKILDFGLAKLAQGQEDVTKEQQLVGSASFMAPELIINGVSDTRTDVYALGILFFLMLTGKKPFTGNTDTVILYKHVNQDVPHIAPLLQPEQHIPPEVCKIIERALSKDPNVRPQDANQFLVDLSAALNDPSIRRNSMSIPAVAIQSHAVSEEDETINRPSLQIDKLEINPTPAPMPPVQPPSNAVVYDEHQQLEMTAVHSATMKNERKSLIITIGIAITLLVVGGTILFLTLTKDNAKPEISNVDEKYAELSKDLKTAENYILENNWDDARKLLQLRDTDFLPYQPLKKQADALNDRIDRATSEILQKANQLAQQNPDEAIRLYQEVLEHYDADNKAAKDGIAGIQNAPVKVTFISDSVSSAKLFANNEEIGTVPGEFELKPGTYAIRIQKSGFEDWTQNITISFGKTESFSFSLTPAPDQPSNQNPTRTLPSGTPSDNTGSSRSTTTRKPHNDLLPTTGHRNNNKGGLKGI